MGPNALLSQMIMKAAMFLIWQFPYFLFFLLLQRRVVDSLACWLGLIQGGELVPKYADFLRQYLSAIIFKSSRTNFVCMWFYYHCSSMFLHHSFQIHGKLFPEWLPARTWTSLIHLYAIDSMQTALALRFCEMDSFITKCDSDDTTTLYLRWMPHSCLIRQISCSFGKASWKTQGWRWKVNSI